MPQPSKINNTAGFTLLLITHTAGRELVLLYTSKKSTGVSNETFAVHQNNELKFSQNQGFFATSQNISFARLKNFTPKMCLTRIAKWVFQDIIKFIKIRINRWNEKKQLHTKETQE